MSMFSLGATQMASQDYFVLFPCDVWVKVLSNFSEHCQLVFLLSLVGRHRHAALEIAKQLWPAHKENWAAHYVLRRTLAPSLAWPRSGSFTNYHLEKTSSQVLEVAKIHFLGLQLGILHDRRLGLDPRLVCKVTLHISSRFSEPLSPAVCAACLLQVSWAHLARWSTHGFQLLQCRVDLWNAAHWHAHVTVTR